MSYLDSIQMKLEERCCSLKFAIELNNKTSSLNS